MLVETTTFRLVDGADLEAFLAADARVQTEFAYQQPGLVRRTTARGSDGEWLVSSIWDSMANAEAAARSSSADQAVAAMMRLVDIASVRTSRYEALD